MDPGIKDISGKKVVLRIEKKFNRLEKLLAKLFRAPKEIRRPLDTKNSMLWQLCDGTRKFEQICSILDSLYHEDISPVIHRTAAGISLLKEKNLLTILDESFTGKWSIGQGITPQNQTLKLSLIHISEPTRQPISRGIITQSGSHTNLKPIPSLVLFFLA